MCWTSIGLLWTGLIYFYKISLLSIINAHGKLFKHETIIIYFMTPHHIANLIHKATTQSERDIEIIGIQMHVWGSNLEWMFDRCLVDCLLSLHFLEMKMFGKLYNLYISNQSLMHIYSYIVVIMYRAWLCVQQ